MKDLRGVRRISTMDGILDGVLGKVSGSGVFGVMVAVFVTAACVAWGSALGAGE